MALELFHVLSRGVDKRTIFLDERDHYRFIHDLFEFNDTAPIISTFRVRHYATSKREFLLPPEKKRNLLVLIHAFCLMRNHYHLLLSACVENGIPKFIKKLNMGFSRYFNERHKRKGTLFEGRYKRVAIKDESHFFHIPYYIHLNPLDIEFSEWRERKISDLDAALQFLSQYRWSSHLDYCGKPNFSSVTQRDFFLRYFGGTSGYAESITRWLKTFDSEVLSDFTLE